MAVPEAERQPRGGVGVHDQPNRRRSDDSARIAGVEPGVGAGPLDWETAMQRRWFHAKGLFKRLHVRFIGVTQPDVRNSQLMGDSGWYLLRTKPDAEPVKPLASIDRASSNHR